MKKMRFLLGILAVLGMVYFTGCQDIDSDNNGQTRLVIKLTDAPFPFDTIEAALVNITRVEIRKYSEGKEEEYPFIPLDMEQEEFNLLDLRNGITAELVDTEIDPGSYDLIRVYVDEVGLWIKQGDKFDLKVPSGEQTGIKVFVDPPIHVATGLTTDLTLDFDVAQSFVLKGNMYTPAGIKGFNFKPVIKAINETTEGRIQGTVTDSETALESASVLLEQVVGEDTFEITSASTDDKGYYAMLGITPGLYQMSATLAGYDTVIYEDVELIAGNLTIQDFMLTKLEEANEGTTTED